MDVVMRSYEHDKKQLFWSMNWRINLQLTTAPLLTKMEVKEESQMKDNCR